MRLRFTSAYIEDQIPVEGKIGRSRSRVMFEDEVLSKIDELDKIHESIMSDNHMSKKSLKEDSDDDFFHSKKPTPSVVKMGFKDEKEMNLDDSEIEPEEHKDGVAEIPDSRVATPVVPQKQQSDTDLFKQRPNTTSLAVPPKSAMARSQSLLAVTPHRPTSANVEEGSQFEEGSVAGSLRSFNHRQKSNFELLRVSY